MWKKIRFFFLRRIVPNSASLPVVCYFHDFDFDSFKVFADAIILAHRLQSKIALHEILIYAFGCSFSIEDVSFYTEVNALIVVVCNRCNVLPIDDSRLLTFIVHIAGKRHRFRILLNFTLFQCDDKWCTVQVRQRHLWKASLWVYFFSLAIPVPLVNLTLW